MGKLRSDDGTVFSLRVRTRVGRAGDNHLVVDGAGVSSVHASIEWRGAGGWEIKDLGSRNGTFLNGELVSSGSWHQLAEGQAIGFGAADRPFTVIDLSRPEAEAVCLNSGDRIVSSDQILTLCDDPENWVDIVEDRPGGWVIERQGRCDPVADGQEIVIDTRRWRLTLPVAEPRTEPLGPPRSPSDASPVGLRFRVSADLEHVELVVTTDENEWQSSRAYTFALLEMARARLRDAAKDIHPDERGWIYADELCAMAGYESDSRLNVEIHRARRDFAKFGLPNPATLIQRRRGTRQLRIGTSALEVEYLGGPQGQHG